MIPGEMTVVKSSTRERWEKIATASVMSPIPIQRVEMAKNGVKRA